MTPTLRVLSLARWAAVALAVALAAPANAQNGSDIPPGYRGSADWIARGVLDGNLIETNFRNFVYFSQVQDPPWGVWPRGTGNRHTDAYGIAVGGYVVGQRPIELYPRAGGRDTLLTPVVLHYGGTTAVGPSGEVWGWLPLNGFHDRTYRDPLTGQLAPSPAVSDEAGTWPAFWPDQPTWLGPDGGAEWNGLFGRGVLNADLESYHVVDDHSDLTYHVAPNGQPYSPLGVFYPSADRSIGGLGLQVKVRTLQFANILAEDAMFILYRITNVGDTDYAGQLTTPTASGEGGLHFIQFSDYGLGWEEGDETAAYDPLLDVVYGYDQNGIGTRPTGGSYPLGYAGYAFLESPANFDDRRDNDQDGITDEQRFSGPGQRIEGQAAIRAFVQSTYNLADFEAFPNYGPLEDRPAFRQGIWWTGDENLDWRAFSDLDGNGVRGPDELLNDDVGSDGLGPNEPNYPGPDADGTEGNGRPDAGEPNFDELDIDESDQIGITGFILSSRPEFLTFGEMEDDTWMWDRVGEATDNFQDTAVEINADVEPFVMWDSGPSALRAGDTDFFSTALLFGANPQDFFKNRQTVQLIYNADYRFAQPPITPRLTAVAGDRRIVLSWDTLSTASFDRFSQQFDFEGYRLYKGTDPLLSDARVVTDLNGTPTFYKPIAQWDLRNGIRGPVPVLGNTAAYNLGSDTGLEFSYVDTDVVNGVTYYYALVAYDRGFDDPSNPGVAPVDPQENTFSIVADAAGNVRATSVNAVVVTARSRAPGYSDPDVNEDLSRPTAGQGTGSIDVAVVDAGALDPDAVYRITFFAEPGEVGDLYQTSEFQITNRTTNQTLVSRRAIAPTTPVADGFVVSVLNDLDVTIDPDRTGWAEGLGTPSPQFSLDPRQLDTYETDWVASVGPDGTSAYVPTSDDYELRWVDPAGPDLYTPQRIGGTLFGDPLPIVPYNVTRDSTVDLAVFDVNRNGAFDVDDEIVIYERPGGAGSRRFRYRVTFEAGDSDTPPSAGDVIRITNRKPFGEGFVLRVHRARRRDGRGGGARGARGDLGRAQPLRDRRVVGAPDPDLRARRAPHRVCEPAPGVHDPRLQRAG